MLKDCWLRLTNYKVADAINLSGRAIHVPGCTNCDECLVYLSHVAGT